LRRGDVIYRQVSAVGALALVAAIFALRGVHWGLSLLVAAICVLVILTALAALFAYQARGGATRAIMDGGEHVPLPEVERQRARLLKLSTRERLAERFESYVRSASNPPSGTFKQLHPFSDRSTVLAVRGELLQAAALIRRTEDSACGIARAEHLLSQGFLIVHGNDPVVLRRELQRVIDPLQAAATSRT
jgi:hypothetical protein